MNTRTGETHIGAALKQAVQNPIPVIANSDEKAAAKPTIQMLDYGTTYFNIQDVISQFYEKEQCLKNQVRLPETATASQCLWVLNYQINKERKFPQKLMTAKYGELFVFSIDKKAVASALNCEKRTIDRALITLFEAEIFLPIGMPKDTKRGKKQDDYSVKIGVRAELVAWFEVVKK